jgi:hypothetical protein
MGSIRNVQDENEISKTNPYQKGLNKKINISL